MTMKQIKSKKQLRAEKERIKQRLKALETKMHIQWQELKQSFTPANIIKDSFSSILKNKTERNLNGESLLKSTFSYGVTLLAGKFAEKVRERFSSVFKK
jgi:hypothetical protein